MNIEIIPSILSADFCRLKADVDLAAVAGVGKVQVDVMDGSFVPNITVGPQVVRALSESTDVKLDVHLMIDEPERFIDAFADAGADVLTVHVEATRHLHRTLQSIRERGLAVGAALNPATPLSALEDVLPDLDVALVMTVNPGFGGQKFIEGMLPKIRRLRAQIDDRGLGAVIQVDGGIDATTARRVVSAGACQLVAGSYVYDAGTDVEAAILRLRMAAEEGLLER